MAEYRVTFGQKYAREPHPTFREAHPDGWVAVEAPDYATARAAVVEAFGIAWAELYGPGAMPSDQWLRTFPRGELDRIAAPPAVTS